jgi:hypothetical protein
MTLSTREIGLWPWENSRRFMHKIPDYGTITVQSACYR